MATELLPLLPPRFGDGWLTKSAQDLCRIAVSFGGYDPQELSVRLAVADLLRKRGRGYPRLTNSATVERVLDEMLAEYRGRT